MTFSFGDCKAILNYDGNIWKKYLKDKNVFVINDNNIICHNDDDTTYSIVVLILSGSNFNRYFLNQYVSTILQNEQKILVPRDSNKTCFNHNSLRFSKDFVDIRLIGRGGFGKVFMAKHRTDLYLYAIKKVVFKKWNLNKDNYQEMLTEFRILATLSHPCVVRYHTAWFEIEMENANHSESDSDSRSSSEYSDNRNSLKPDSLITFGSRSNDDLSEGYTNTSQIICGTNNSQSSRHDWDKSKSMAIFGKFSSHKVLCGTSQRSSRVSFHHSTNNGTLDIVDKCSRTITDRLVLYIQMELCNNNLKDWLETRNRLPGMLTQEDRKMTRSLARQLLSAVDYIHSLNVVHRDIKPANLLLMEHVHGGNCDLQLKIGDFGLAKSLTIEDGIFTNHHLSANVGTSFYRAPEVYSNGQHCQYNDKCDLYSVGVILLELMFKFSTMTELCHVINKIKEGDPDGILSFSWPIEAIFVMNLLSSDVRKRPSAGFILHKTISFKDFSVESRILQQLASLTEENKVLRRNIENLETELELLKNNRK